ncbi:MAG: hypothetical protein DDT21_02303 [Syntrophomonadaceae bacterium]|nr:hypothetical protein [Bacillota bacterium]
MTAWGIAHKLVPETASRHSPHGEDVGMSPYIEQQKAKYNLWWVVLHRDEQMRTCFFCKRRKDKINTGNLPGIGTIMKCADCQADYDALRKMIEEIEKE